MISFVAAMDRNRVIGHEGGMPWHLPADLKFFKQVTSGNKIVMGRKTYESIGRPLPNRTNIIVTTQADYKAEGCIVYHDLDEVKKWSTTEEEVFVIGGQQLFEVLMPVTNKMYLTFIDETFQGDTYFPDWNESEWKIVDEQEGIVDEKNRYPHRFVIFKRK